jgi:chromosome segregation ATPase
VASRLKKLEDEIGKTGSAEHADTKKVEEELAKTKELLENKIKGLEGDISKIASIGISDIGKTREQIEKETEEELKHFREATAKKIKDVEEEISKIASIEITELNKTKVTLEKKTEEELTALKEANSKRIKDVEEELKKFAEAELKNTNRMEGELALKIKEVNAHLERFKSVDTEAVKKFREEVHKTDDHIENRLKALEKNLAVEGSDEAKDYRKLAEELKKLRQDIDSESATRISIDKRLQAAEEELSGFEHVERESLMKLSRVIDEFRKNELEKQKHDFEEFKHALDEESAKRISLEKMHNETEATLKALEYKVGRIENVDDLASLGGKIHDLERNMKMASVRLLTQQLNEFAKAMDKRLPNIVSREEYRRELADVHQRLRTMESPDLAPLGARVERLERKIEEVVGMIRSVYNRVPVVVE